MKITSDPAILYHYTTLEALIGIIKNRELWASNVLYLNDKGELNHAIKWSKEAIEIIQKDYAIHDWETSLKRVASEFMEGKFPDVFVTCFCEDSDSLTMWRGYTGGTQGIAIGFRTPWIRRLARRNRGSLMNVMYTNKTTRQKLAKHFSEGLYQLINEDTLDGFDDEEEKYIAAKYKLSIIIPKFKHISFADEAEWRSVFYTPKAETRFRVKGSRIIPYIKIPITEFEISQITIGPGIDQDTTSRSIKALLQDSSLSNIEIVQSDSPYRD